MRRFSQFVILMTLCLFLISFGECEKKKSGKTDSCEKGVKGCNDEKKESKYTKEFQFQCDYCSKGFPTEEQLRQHKRDKHGILPSKKSTGDKENFRCEFCSKVFDSYEALIQHKRDKHKIEEKDDLPSTKKIKTNAFICDICSKAFRTHDQFLQHQRDAHGDLKRTRDLKEEELKENNDYLCPVCMKKFKSEQSLNQHQQATGHYDDRAVASSHNGKKGTSSDSTLLQCPVCMKKFKSKRSLDQHQRATGHYKDEGPSENTKQSPSSVSFQCPVCMKKFKSEHELLQHQSDTNHNNRDASKQKRKQALYTLHREVSVDVEDKKESVQVVKKIVDDIMREVRGLEGGSVYSPSVRKAGSYAAKTKIGKADEFDMNIPLEVKVEEIRTFGRLGYSYEDKKHGSRNGPSAKNMNVDRHIVDDPDSVIPERQAVVRPQRGTFPEPLLFRGDLIPHKVLQDLYRKVQKAIRNLKLNHVFLNRESHGPALTLVIKQTDEHDISVDLVLSIPCDYHVSVSDGGWPRLETKLALTREQIERALDAGMHLVPKGDETWSISYSKVERALFETLDKGHQCRRRVMQTIKRYVQKCKSRSRDGYPGISSHVVKNQILWSVEKRAEDDYWNEKNFDTCLVGTIEDLILSLQNRLLLNYFDTSENILADKDRLVLDRLANCLQEEVEFLS